MIASLLRALGLRRRLVWAYREGKAVQRSVIERDDSRLKWDNAARRWRKQ